MRARFTLTLVALLTLAALAGCAKKKTTAPTNATLAGTVQHLDGSAYSSAFVDLESLVPINGTVDIATVTSDTTGAFALGGLHATAYSISVIQEDSLAVADTVTAPASGIVLRLQPGTVLRGVALRPDPTDHSAVIVVTDLPTTLALTDTSGFFELRGVAPGLREITASDPLSGTVATVAMLATPGDTIVLDTLRLHTAAVSPLTRLRLDAARARLARQRPR